MSEWRMILVALILAACGNVRTSGESWLVGADGEKFLPESKTVGDNYAGPVLTIEPARPDGSDIHLADDQGPVALSIMLPASPGVGRSAEAVRMAGGCGVPGCLVYHGGGSVEAVRFTPAIHYGPNIYSQDGTITIDRGSIISGAQDCLRQTATGWEVCR